LHLETLWTKDVTITMGLVDTSSLPQLLGLLAGGQLDPSPLVTHHFELGQMVEAYDAFSDAAHTGALKVLCARA
jgi:alcohol dehydrogenase